MKVFIKSYISCKDSTSTEEEEKWISGAPVMLNLNLVSEMNKLHGGRTIITMNNGCEYHLMIPFEVAETYIQELLQKC